ncbi:Nucleoside-diphosphate-sugar pyrophosphorylase family protein [Thermoplasmatales archaeon SCGC AB-539-N05]|nr:Nucleoside-diphosphate-sugar pyrophosphorylase family protein [Thermoplasmatales archaeon SCGC AB-539-N05]
MQMVIPCGGLATRLGGLAKNTPKALIDINGKPFLEHQLDLIRKYDFDEVVLCIGHLGEKIQSQFGNGTKYGIKILYSYDDQLGVIGAIKNAEEVLHHHFFMMYGDSYLPKLDFNDMYSKFLSQDKLAMMSVWQNNNEIDPSNIKVNAGEVISAGEDGSDYVDYGAIVLDKKVLEIIPKNKNFSTKKFWKLLSKKRQLAAYEVYDRFYHIGNPERLEEVKKLLKKNR